MNKDIVCGSSVIWEQVTDIGPKPIAMTVLWCSAIGGHTVDINAHSPGSFVVALTFRKSFFYMRLRYKAITILWWLSYFGAQPYHCP